MYVICCPFCGSTVVYDSYEESIAAEFCPHCLSKKEFESDIRYGNVTYDLNFITRHHRHRYFKKE